MRGDRPRPRPRSPAVRPRRRGGAGPLPAGTLRRRLPPPRALAAGGRHARARRPRAEPDRAGARRDRQPLGPRDRAGDARGQDRPPRRPRRLHQPRHRRRRARRGARRPATCPPAPIAILGDTGQRRIDMLVHDLVEHSDAAGDIVQGEVVGAAMSELRAFMFERVYLGPVATREHVKIDLRDRGAVRPLLRPSGGDPGLDPATASCRVARDRLPGRDDRPLLHPTASSSSASRSRSRQPDDSRGDTRTMSSWAVSVSRYTADSGSRCRGRHAGAGLARTELRRAGVNSYFGLCPFHDERTRFVPRPARREALPLLRLPGVRRPVRLRDGDRGARLQGGAGVAGRPLRGQARDARTRTRRPRPGASGGERLYALLGRAATYYARYLWEASEAQTRSRVPAGARPRRGDAARVPGRLRAQRLGPDAHGLAQGRLQRRGAAGRRAGPALRAIGPAASTTASASGSCSRPPTRAGRVHGFGARRDARQPAARSTSTPPTASSTTSARSCSGSTWRARPAAKRRTG